MTLKAAPNYDTLTRNAWSPTSEEDNRLVLAALEEILTSAPFRSSRRYPTMLRYIVGKTLSNQSGELKERTIGIEVFGRNPTYDTNADPVVRFSAGEIRRRLAQFYLESGTTSPLAMELPSGTYVPRFFLRQTDTAKPEPILPDPIVTQPEPEHAESAPKKHSFWWLAGIAMVLLGVAIGIWALRNSQTQKVSPLMQVWSPIINNPDPVLISVGRPVPEEGDKPEPSDISIGDHILRPEFRVSIASLDAIANVVGYLKTWGKAFRIHEANSNTLSDFHDRPVVLVTGNNNKWSVLLLKQQRFHFVQVGQLAYIEDAQHPDFRGWSVDFTKPFFSQTADYAIISRFSSQTTEGPVIVAAGISSNGTEAAGEYIVSPSDLEKLAKLSPTGTLTGNFEAVLKIEVVGGNTGAATVVASQFW